MFTIKVKKTGREYSIDESKVKAHVVDFMTRYGWTQFLGDSLSQFSLEGSKSTTKSTPDEMHDMITATIERLYNGEVRQARAIDTHGRMAFNLALKKVMNVWLKKNPGKTTKDYTDARADAQDEYSANQSKYDDMATSLIELTSGEEV